MVDRKDNPKIPEQLPVLPINDMVIYPSAVIPISVSDDKSVEASEQASLHQKLFISVALRPGEPEEITPEDMYDIGTVVTIHKLMRFPDGSIKMVVQGVQKIKIVKFIQIEPFFKAEIEVIEEPYTITKTMQAKMRNLLNNLQKMVSMVPYLPDEIYATASNLDDPNRLAYLIATILKMEVEERQQILEYKDVNRRLDKVNEVLQRELEIVEIGNQLQDKVQTKMDKTQREYYLREQMKAIRQELGEDEGTEVQDLKERVEEADLPEEAMKQAERELKRLEKLPDTSSEYHVIRTYLDLLLDLPWNESTEDNLDLKRVRKILDDDHYDLDEIKERLVEYLAVRKLKEDMKGPILCFAGPPGVGKTSLGQSIARALGREFVRFSLGGMRDEAEIRGHRRTYIGAMPGRIIQGIRRAGSNNPVFMLDEIDKVGADFRGDPASALLEVLDPAQNDTFRDHYVDVAFDLSKVLFIATANTLETIHPALRDRVEVITLAGYSENEKVHIARKYLVPRQMKEHGLTSDNIIFYKSALKKMISNYTREAGVRNLEREIAKVCRKVARKVAEGEEKAKRITSKNVHKYLGPPKIFPEVAKRTARPGVSTGLAWTPTGGDILFIESVIMPGKGGLTLTGQLGDVMQESARAALSYIRSKEDEYGLDRETFKKSDIHLHVPAGAIPKDGPSAGITITTSLLSVLTGQPVKNDVAMTGEITLSGLVLPVGGIKEKVLAARRAGIKMVILPKRNEKDVDQLDKKLIKDLDFIYVENIDDVLQNAFEKLEQKE